MLYVVWPIGLALSDLIKLRVAVSLVLAECQSGSFALRVVALSLRRFVALNAHLAHLAAAILFLFHLQKGPRK